MEHITTNEIDSHKLTLAKVENELVVFIDEPDDCITGQLEVPLEKSAKEYRGTHSCTTASNMQTPCTICQQNYQVRYGFSSYQITGHPNNLQKQFAGRKLLCRECVEYLFSKKDKLLEEDQHDNIVASLL